MLLKLSSLVFLPLRHLEPPGKWETSQEQDVCHTSLVTRCCGRTTKCLSSCANNKNHAVYAPAPVAETVFSMNNNKGCHISHLLSNSPFSKKLPQSRVVTHLASQFHPGQAWSVLGKLIQVRQINLHWHCSCPPLPARTVCFNTSPYAWAGMG